jgi:hypothetical protein
MPPLIRFEKKAQIFFFKDFGPNFWVLKGKKKKKKKKKKILRYMYLSYFGGSPGYFRFLGAGQIKLFRFGGWGVHESFRIFGGQKDVLRFFGAAPVAVHDKLQAELI